MTIIDRDQLQFDLKLNFLKTLSIVTIGVSCRTNDSFYGIPPIVASTEELSWFGE